MRSLPQMVVFLSVITGIVFGWHYFLWARLVRDPALSPGVRVASTIFLVVMGALMPAVMILQRSLPRAILRPLALVAYSWMGVAFFLFFALLFAEIIRLVATFASARGPDLAANVDRRLLLSRLAGGAAAVVGAGASAYGLVRALGSIPVERVRIALSRLPRALNGTTIVQISDVHIGPTMGRVWLAGVVEKVNALSPDVIAITGDLVDGSVAELAAEVAPLAGLRAKYGVFFVTGNHEYYSGAPQWVEHLRGLGIRVLENEHVSIGEGEASYILAGVNDFNAPFHGHDVKKATLGIQEGREIVLLAHQPRSITEAAAHGVGLQLSGHTHGGQMFPWNLFVKLQQPFVAGLHRVEKTWVYVHRGTGFWGPPMRVGAPPEITRLELFREGNEGSLDFLPDSAEGRRRTDLA